MSTPTADEALSRRKAKHLEICVEEHRYDVEGGDTGFGGIRFVHNAMPELSLEEIDPSVEFLGCRIPLPLHISCMTGGSESGFKANKDLARAAQAAGIPVGMGSIRILFKDPDLYHHFHLKAAAPDVPVIANIGAVQLPDIDTGKLTELCKKLEVDALAVHLNPGQEIFQPEGDTDFRGLKQAIGVLCGKSSLPVIVKETGCGMTPELIHELISLGAAYVDVAGSGGTNWITVEGHRADTAFSDPAGDFRDWGIPTALTLAAAGYCDGKIIASGGIRSGMDIAKSIALGAALTGSALPFIRAVRNGGQEAAALLIDQYAVSLRSVMLLTGSKDISALRTAARWYEPDFKSRLTSFHR